MLNAAQIAQVHSLASAATDYDGVAPLNEQTLLTLNSPRAHHFLTYSGSQMIAFGSVIDHSGELVVHPEFRRRGWGGAMLQAMRTKEGDHLSVWAHGNTEAAQALTKKAGLEPVRELLIMAAPLPGSKLPSAPAGYKLTTFRPGIDDHAWVELNAAAFASHPEQGRLTIADLHQRMLQPWFDPTAFFMLWHGKDLAGFIWMKPEEGNSEIYVVAVSPGHQGKGLGGFLTNVGLAVAAQRAGQGQWSDSQVILYTDGSNTAARKAYERAGFEIARLDMQYRPR